MSALDFIFYVWLIGAILFFLLLITGKYNVKVTNYKSGHIYFATGFKKICIYILFSVLWPCICIYNMIMGE